MLFGDAFSKIMLSEFYSLAYDIDVFNVVHKIFSGLR